MLPVNHMTKLYVPKINGLFMPPTSKKNFEEVEGAYWFGPVHPSVHLSVCLSVRNTFWQLRNSRNPYARILKFYMWHVHEKQVDPYFFFPPPVLSFWSYAPFSTMCEQPC